ncbi:hypothetical protein C8R42DRAFT_755954 [Lentinula raphanica]|nr:hypothetical protein C8R42DRAFT_755954 [Lentinula raphanica]
MTRKEEVSTKRMVARPAIPQTQTTPVRASESLSTNGSNVPGTGLDPNGSQTSLPSAENTQSAAAPQNGQQFVIITQFKPNHEEDIYQHISMLLQDALQQHIVRVNQTDDDLNFKVDELDVPGKYTKNRDNNQNFIKIQ